MGVGAEVEPVDVGGVEEQRHLRRRGERPRDGHHEQDAQRPRELHDAEEDQRPDQVELLLHRQRPGVDQRRGKAGHVEVVRARNDEVPVGEVEERGERVAAQRRIGAGRDEDAVDDGDADEHDEERRQQAPGAAGPEGPQPDGAPLAPLHDQERGDEEARQGEEAVEEEEPARGQVHPGVHAQDGEHGDAPNPVEGRQVGERCPLARCVRGDACRHRRSVPSPCAAGSSPGPRPPRPADDLVSLESPAHCDGTVPKGVSHVVDRRGALRSRPGWPRPWPC